MALLLAAGVIAAGFLFYYRVHLLWQFAGPESVRPIPTSPMPETPPGEGWPDCRLGPLRFRLPPESLDNVEIKGDRDVATIAFRDQSRSMIIVVPVQPHDVKQRWASLRREHALPPEGQGLSFTRLRLASYQASSDDFRWSMTPQEVRWLDWRLSMRFLFAIMAPARAEYLLGDGLEGIADYAVTGRSVSFDWETADERFGASVVFTDRSGQIDPTWVRSVCQSLRFSEDRLAEPMPTDDQGWGGLFEVNRAPMEDDRKDTR